MEYGEVYISDQKIEGQSRKYSYRKILLDIQKRN